MSSLLNKIPNEIRDISTLVVGNGFAIFIPVLVSPIISRMYTSGDFGVFTIYVAMISLISSFATGRYDFAILMAKTKNNAQQLYKVALSLAAIISLLVFLVVLFFDDTILSVFSVESMGWLVYLVPVNIFLYAAIHANQNGLNREKDYNAISVGKTIRSVFVGGIQVGLGAIGYLGSGLILGKLSGDLFSSAYLTSRLNKIDHYLTSSYSFRRASYVMRKYEKFLKVNAPHAFVNALSLSVTPMIIGYFFNKDIVGFYGLSYMVCILPVQLVGTAFYQVFSQKVSVMFNNGEGLNAYTKKTIKLLFGLSIVPFTVLTIFGPELFSFVFGAEWVTSGEYVQILAPFLFLVFILSPITYIPLIYEEQNKSFYFEVTLFLSRVVALSVGASLGNIYLALALFSGVSIFIQTINLLWVVSLTNKYHTSV